MKRVNCNFLVSVFAVIAGPMFAPCPSFAELVSTTYAIGKGSNFTGNFLLLADMSDTDAPKASGFIDPQWVAQWETLPILEPLFIGGPTDIGNCVQISASGLIESSGAPCDSGRFDIFGTDGNVAMFSVDMFTIPNPTTSIVDTGFAAEDVVLRINHDPNWPSGPRPSDALGNIPMLGSQTERLIGSGLMFGANIIGSGSGAPNPNGGTGPTFGCLEVDNSGVITSTGFACGTNSGGLILPSSTGGRVVQIDSTEAGIEQTSFSADNVAQWSDGTAPIGPLGQPACVEVNSSGKLKETTGACSGSSTNLTQADINTGIEEMTGKPLTARDADLMRGKWAGTTGGSGSAYTATATGFVRGKGSRIILRMHAANTGNASLNVNDGIFNTGALSIMINNSTTLPAGVLKLNGVYMFVKDDRVVGMDEPPLMEEVWSVVGDNYPTMTQSNINTGTETTPKLITAVDMDIARGKIPTASATSTYSGLTTSYVANIPEVHGQPGARIILKLSGAAATNGGTTARLSLNNGSSYMTIRVNGSDTLLRGTFKEGGVYMFVYDGSIARYHAIGMGAPNTTLNTVEDCSDYSTDGAGTGAFWDQINLSGMYSCFNGTSNVECKRFGDIVTVTLNWHPYGLTGFSGCSPSIAAIFRTKFRPKSKVYCSAGFINYDYHYSDPATFSSASSASGISAFIETTGCVKLANNMTTNVPQSAGTGFFMDCTFTIEGNIGNPSSYINSFPSCS